MQTKQHKKSLWTRFVALVMVLALLCGLLPTAALGADVKSSTDGETYDQTTTVTMDGTGIDTKMTIESYIASRAAEATVKATDVIFVLDQSVFTNGDDGSERSAIIAGVKEVVDNLPEPTNGDTNKVAIVGYGRINQWDNPAYNTDSALENDGNHPGVAMGSHDYSYNTGFYVSPDHDNNITSKLVTSGLQFYAPPNSYTSGSQSNGLIEASDKYTMADSDYDGLITISDNVKQYMTYQNAFMTATQADENFLNEPNTNMAKFTASASRLDVGLVLAKQLVEVAKENAETESKDRNTLICVVAGTNCMLQNGETTSVIRTKAAIKAAQEMKDNGATIITLGDYHKISYNLSKNTSNKIEDTQDNFEYMMTAMAGSSKTTYEENADYFFSRQKSNDLSAAITAAATKMVEVAKEEAETVTIPVTLTSSDNITNNSDTTDWTAWLQKVAAAGGTAEVTYADCSSYDSDTSTPTWSDEYGDESFSVAANLTTDEKTGAVTLSFSSSLIPLFPNSTEEARKDTPATRVKAVIIGVAEVTYAWASEEEGYTPNDAELPNPNPETVSASGFTLPDITTDDGHYRFLGWYTEQDNDDETALSGVVKPTAEEMTLYGKWEKGFAVNYYTKTDITATYDPDNDTPEKSSFVATGGTVSSADYTAQSTPTGYEFAGWYTDPSCEDEDLFTSQTGFTEDLNLYAKYTGKQLYYRINWLASSDGVNYAQKAGGEWIGTVGTYVDYTSRTEEQKYVAPFYSTGLYRLANVVYSTKDGSTTFDGVTPILAYTDSNKMLKIQLYYDPAYTITASVTHGTATPSETNGGSAVTSIDETAATTTATVILNSSETITFAPEVGYTLASVTVDGEEQALTALTDGTYTFSGVTANHSIAVVYEKSQAEQVTVTYDLNSGTGAEGADYGQKTVDKGSDVTVAAAPTRGGYTFTNWQVVNEDDASAETTTTAANETLTVNNNTKLVAQWTENSYTIKYDGNGNTNSGTTMADQTLTYTELNSTTNPTLTENTFVKTGYTFLGWSTEKDAAAATYADQAELTASVVSDLDLIKQGEVTLYAVWQQNFTITVNVTNGTAKDGDDAVTSGSTVTVDSGSDKTLTFAANEGYALESVEVVKTGATDSALVKAQVESLVSDGTYTFENVTDDYTITVVYATDENGDKIPDSHQVTVTYKVVNGTWDGTDTADKTEVVTVDQWNAEQGKYVAKDPAATLSNVPNTTSAAPSDGYTSDGAAWTESTPVNGTTTVTKDTTYTYTFPAEYTITVNVVNGTATLPISSENTITGTSDKATKSYTVTSGKDTEISFAPTTGYALESAAVKNGDSDAALVALTKGTDSTCTYQFTNVTENKEITVVFDTDAYGPGTDNAKDPNPDGIPDKHQATVTYKIENGIWEENGNDTDKNYAITVETMNNQGKWEAVTPTATLNGTVPNTTSVVANQHYTTTGAAWDSTPTSATTVAAGEAYTYTYTLPSQTYTITVNVTNGTATLPDGDTGKAITGTSEQASDSFTVSSGANATINFAATSGYALESVAVTKGSGDDAASALDAEQVANLVSKGAYTFSNVDSDYTITVVYDTDENGDEIPDSHQVTVTYKVVNGTWDGTDTADKTEVVTVDQWNAEQGKYVAKDPAATLSNVPNTTSAAPSDGYTGDGAAWTESTPVNGTTTVTKDTTYTYTFPEIGKHTVTVTVENGTASAAATGLAAPVSIGDSITTTEAAKTPVTVNDNGTVSLTFTGNEKTALESVAIMVNGVAQAVPMTKDETSGTYSFTNWDPETLTYTYTFSNVKADSDIVVVYAADTYGPDGDNDNAKDPNPDGIPDSHQAVVTYKIVGGTWDGTADNNQPKAYAFNIQALDENGTWKAVAPAPTLGSTLPTGMTVSNGYINPGAWDVTDLSSSTAVTKDVTYTYTYPTAPDTYTITVNVTNGTAKDGEADVADGSVLTVASGGDKTLTFAANEGYALDTVTVTNGAGGNALDKDQLKAMTNSGTNTTNGDYTFSGVKDNYTITVVYERDVVGEKDESHTDISDGVPDKYQAVVAYTVENGTWGSDGATKITHVVTFVDEIKDGSAVWTELPASASEKLSEVQGGIPNTMQPKDGYDGENGSWKDPAPTDDTVIKPQDNLSFTYTYPALEPAAEYTITVNVTNGTATLPDGDTGKTITGTSEQATGNYTVTSGADTKVTFAAATGYALESVTVTKGDATDPLNDATQNGNVKDSGFYALENVTDNYTITVVYAADTYGPDGDNANAKVDTPDSIPDSHQVVITYQVENGTWDGTDTADKTEVVTVDQWNAEQGKYVPLDTTPTLSNVPDVTGAEPDETHQTPGSWTGKEPVQGTTQVTGPETYVYSFPEKEEVPGPVPAVNTVTVTVVGGEGTVTNDTATKNVPENTKTDIEVEDNGKVTVTITPDDGYVPQSVTVNGEEQDLTNLVKNDDGTYTYVYDPVTEDIDIVVTFVKEETPAPAPDSYTITVNVTNGTAKDGDDSIDTNGGTVTVTSGDNKTLTFAPNDGYVLESAAVGDDGQPVNLTGNTDGTYDYTFTNVQEDTSITVVFAEKTYNVYVTIIGGDGEASINGNEAAEIEHSIETHFPVRDQDQIEISSYAAEEGFEGTLTFAMVNNEDWMDRVNGQNGVAFTVDKQDYSVVLVYAHNASLNPFVIYVPNGGTHPTENYDPDQTSNNTATVKPDPVKEGYTFHDKVWVDQDGNTADGDGTPYQEGEKITVDKDIILSADWDPITYLVKFDANNDKAAGTMDDQAFVYNQTQSLRTNTYAADGYKFLGWAAEKNGSVVYSDGATVSVDDLLNNLIFDETTTTLYAVWEKVGTITVTYKPDNGDDNWTKDITSASTVDPKPSKDGYTFTGWKDENTGKVYQPGDSLSNVKDDITLVAQWEKIPSSSSSSGKTTYTLTYESNGGTQYSAEKYPSGTTVNLDKTPVREGYQFTGWYADKDLTQPITSIKMTSSATVYAGWKANTVPSELNGDDHIGYIIGYPDGSVRPGGSITRAEVATIFFRLLEDDVREANLTTENTFSDVSSSAWYCCAVSTLASMGIVDGRSDTIFDPNAPITRAELAAICARFDSTDVSGSGITFSDVAGHWAQDYIEKAAALGWVQGYEDGTFQPNADITRAEAMTLINRVLCRIPASTSDLLDGMNEWPDNAETSRWYYLAVQEATNSHDFEKNGEVNETWTTLTAVPDWAQYER